MCCVNLEVSSRMRVRPRFLPQRLDLLPHELHQFQGSEMSIDQLYEYYADSQNGLRGDMHDCRMVSTRGEVAEFVAENLIYTREEWLARLPGVPEIADVPDEQEEYKKSIDGYHLENFLHH